MLTEYYLRHGDLKRQRNAVLIREITFYVGANQIVEAIKIDSSFIGILQFGRWDRQQRLALKAAKTTKRDSDIVVETALPSDSVRIRESLGTNRLTLNRVLPGKEPEVLMFDVPIRYELATNIGSLHLFVDGESPQLQWCGRGTNGDCVLTWIRKGPAYQVPEVTLRARLFVRGWYRVTVTGPATKVRFEPTGHSQPGAAPARG